MRNTILVLIGAGITLGCLIIVSMQYTMLQSTQKAMANVRHNVFCDRFNCAQYYGRGASDNTEQCSPARIAPDINNEASCDEAVEQVCRVQVLKTRSYTQAVRYAGQIREKDDIICDIIREDSVSDKNMVVWYKLVTPAFASSVCDTLVDRWKRRDKVKWIHKIPI